MEEDHIEQQQTEHQEELQEQQEETQQEQQQEQQDQQQTQVQQTESLLNKDEQKIIKYVIKNSHYGETQEVIKELKKIVQNFSVEDPFVQNILREHNEEHLAIVDGSKYDYKGLISPISYQQDDGYYLDQKHSCRIKVDCQTLQVIDKQELQLEKNETFEEYRNLVDKYLVQYLEQYYKPDNYQYQIFIDFDNESFIFYVCLTCKNLNLKNFHGGEWISEWKIDTSGLNGKIRINSHYFEDGNVALKDIKNVTDEFTFSGENKEEEAKSIVKIIQKHESEIQNSLDDMYENMNSLFFQGMRRVLPITNQKMEWNLFAQKMRGNLGTQ